MVTLYEIETNKNNDHIIQMNQLREQQVAEVKNIMKANFAKKRSQMQEEIDVLRQQLNLEQESCQLKVQYQQSSKQQDGDVLTELTILREMRLSEAEDRKIQQETNKKFLELTMSFFEMYNRMENTTKLLASKLQSSENYQPKMTHGKNSDSD